MDVFDFRRQLIDKYAAYVASFQTIRDDRVRAYVAERLQAGDLWPEPLLQLNPSFEPAEWIDELVEQRLLHEECARIFRIKPSLDDSGRRMRLHRHQADAIRTARDGHNFVLTTGTGSGKSLAYIVPIVDRVLRRGSGRGIQAIVVYPMNALANSQAGELEKFLCQGYPAGHPPVTFRRYTGQESQEEREAILASPPDILLTNYVMLELILTRPFEAKLVEAAQGLQFLVLDELHTYRGRQGADVALLVRRARETFSAPDLQHIGTSATLAGEGSFDEQRRQVAEIASLLFGSEVRPDHVIGETLTRATPVRDLSDAAYVQALTERVRGAPRRPPADFAGFVADPLSSWIEETFGLAVEPESGRLIRARPRGISGESGAARELSDLTGVPEGRCVEALQAALLAGYHCEPNPETGFPPFAFRLHQFISRGDAVYASLEPERQRAITFQGQQYVPGDRGKILLPIVFCRECGQEYYAVWATQDPATGLRRFSARDLSDISGEAESVAGFLFSNSAEPWPADADAALNRLPEDWLEERRGATVVRRDRQKDLPKSLRVDTLGRECGDGLDYHFLAAPFRFCLSCGVEYAARQTDFAKLATLSSEGRSTATTILSLFAIRGLRADETLPERAKKLLSFTDNRQDASLQAGHFNDFIEIGLLRSALYRAVRDAGAAGMTHDELTQRVFDALDLPLHLYASDPSVRFAALTDTKRSLREVLGYNLYRDLRRGWRITSPNLEQCGLLDIRYRSLDEVCETEDVWQNRHPSLVAATPARRMSIARTLLDFMRRELAIKVDYLETAYQERIQQQSSQRLVPPWALDESESGRMEHARVLYPRAGRADDYRGNIYLGPRSRFGQYLRRQSTFPEGGRAASLDETEVMIHDLLAALRVGGLVEVVTGGDGRDEAPGYQLPAAALLWLAGDGVRAFHDPLRTPNESAEGGRTNRFFVELYRAVAATTQTYEAREHTAQVPYEAREEREKRFREGSLPILYCSPTMELGVDIAELNVVNLRNVPPTPANYAQRSGRAGRNGQPALVFSYCSTFGHHDQYFFRRPHLMVAGAVAPPRLDVANEDLVRAHVQAIWLRETGLSLGSSLRDLLDLSGRPPRLSLFDWVQEAAGDPAPRQRALARARLVLATIGAELEASDWWSDGWLPEVLAQAGLQFDRACDRWRGLYRAALAQAETQHLVILDASRSQDDKNEAARLRREAEAQLALLTQEQESRGQSDFYSYRYFASEGFLPGYSFPRLPLSAFIPGRRATQDRKEFVSRPRFLAISEFGPRAVLYHEGSRYSVNKVILPARDDDNQSEEGPVVTQAAKQCAACGYLHRTPGGAGADLCERCGRELPAPMTNLFRMQNVSTRRRDRITSDEEERQRLGYELRTGLRFELHGGRPSHRSATVELDGAALLRLAYGQAATIWRINLGWRRRKEPDQYGFVLDTERGYWARNELAGDADDPDPLSQRSKRVIPFVEDRRNCLLVEPSNGLSTGEMASLQAALKSAIQARYQLEDNELAAEPLPDRDSRSIILLYESAEGGAGVLRRLIDDQNALAGVAREALQLCHFDAMDGTDLRRAPHAREDCEAACYDCLMTYANQGDHELLDRASIRDLLLQLAAARVIASPAPVARAALLEQLMELAGSALERAWLQFLEARSLHLPSAAQTTIEKCRSRPDFLYEQEQVAIYVDGPPHDFPDRQQRDQAQTDCLEDCGYTVLRFRQSDNWDALADSFPHVFGAAAPGGSAQHESAAPPDRAPVAAARLPDLDLFGAGWEPIVRALVEAGAEVEPCGDLVDGSGRVVGRYGAEVRRNGRRLRLLDTNDETLEPSRRACREAGVPFIVSGHPVPASGLATILTTLDGAP